MAPLDNDMGSTPAQLLSSKDGEILGRMNSIQRISARSLMMIRPKGKNAEDKSGRSLRGLLQEHSQPTPSFLSPTEMKQELTVVEEHETEILSSDPTARTEATEGMIPMEVTVIDESGFNDHYRGIGADMKLDEAQYEAREYFQQLKASKEEVETLSKDLKKSKKQLQELIIHNKTMLDHVKTITKKDEATFDTHAMLKQEITLLKACLFLSMIFVMCGGRAEIIALVVLGWTFADVFV
jgi:hypothetical protein